MLDYCIIQSTVNFTFQFTTSMRIIITGATGMVGEGVLMACLQEPEITEILSVSRKPLLHSHPKLKEYLVSDFLSLDLNDPVLKGYDACFFCAGVSSLGMSEAEYTRITYDTTLHFAKSLAPNPDMSFVYVSGKGTDSSEKGNSMWARVKGKTENDLMKLPFKQVFGYRVGVLTPMPGQKHVLKYYSYLSWLIPLFKILSPSLVCSLKEVALSMIYVAMYGHPENVISVKEVTRMAKLQQASTK